jgi:hypothetical protein
VCDSCSRPFTLLARANQIYCSDACRVNAQRDVHGRVNPNGAEQQTVASVPFMLTEAMRAALRARGFSDDQIRAMRPAAAHAALAADPEPVRQPVEQPRSSAVDSLRAARMACGSQPSAPPRPSEGERIRSAREARGWSQKRLATEAETHQPCVSSLERDRQVNAPTRTRVLDALGLIAEQLDQGD